MSGEVEMTITIKIPKNDTDRGYVDTLAHVSNQAIAAYRRRGTSCNGNLLRSPAGKAIGNVTVRGVQDRRRA